MKALKRSSAVQLERLAPTSVVVHAKRLQDFYHVKYFVDTSRSGGALIIFKRLQRFHDESFNVVAVAGHPSILAKVVKCVVDLFEAHDWGATVGEFPGLLVVMLVVEAHEKVFS